jgi:hypothetical protein
MQLLAANQIKHIEDRIASANIKNNSLAIDILDHICCMIEERLDLGWEYTKAEKEVFNQMGVLQMQAIEQETKMLTQNKFTMKKRTIIIGLVALLLMIAGFVMKQLHLLGAGVTWGVGVLVAVFGFVLFLAYDRFSYERTTYGKVTRIIGYLGAGSYLLGMGLNVLRLPLSYILMGVGGLILLVYYALNNLVRTQEKLS